MSGNNNEYPGLDILLQLSDEIFPMENGCWTKIEAKRVVWDHRHERKIVEPYEFENAGQLLEDFWADVERILFEKRR